MKFSCWWCVKLNYWGLNVFIANELGGGKLDRGVFMSWTKLVYWFMHLCWWCTCCWWGRSNLWKGLWKTPGKLCVLLLEEVPRQTHLEALEFYWEPGICHGSKKLLELLIMEPPLERSPYFYSAWCFSWPGVTLAGRFLPFSLGCFWRTKSLFEFPLQRTQAACRLYWALQTSQYSPSFLGEIEWPKICWLRLLPLRRYLTEPVGDMLLTFSRNLVDLVEISLGGHLLNYLPLTFL